MEFDQSEPVRARRKRELPTFYYHGHFVELLDFVSSHYGHVLRRQDIAFLETFGKLDREAQCLYVRLANRKGRIFAASKLRYPELGPLVTRVRSLEEAGLVGRPGEANVDDLLGFLTRDQLHAAVSGSLAGIAKSLRKDLLIDIAREHVRPGDLVARVASGDLLVQEYADTVSYLLFLFFGRIHEGLSRFTMRDLGLVRVHDSKESFEPRFAEREEALECYYFASRLARIEAEAASVAGPIAAEATDWPEPMFAASARLRDKLAYRTGRALERAGDRDGALELYAMGESVRCIERRIRVLLAAGRQDEARSCLETCLDEPGSDEEWLFAQDLYERKFEKKRTSRLTDRLRAAETIDIDESQSGSPERAAAGWFEARGQRAFRTENGVWRTLFGLLFWDELFGDESADLHSPFDFVPPALLDGSFHRSRERAVAARLADLDDPAATKKRLLMVSTRHYGTSNGVFRWRRSMLDAVFALVDCANADSLRQVLRLFAVDYRRARYGYPDLLVIDRDGPRFVEIKTEGDSLRRNQLVRLEQLRNAGFRADVVRIRWILDPDQSYAVVDVETTGGRGEHHRVTEIGAVKVRNGRIVDRFETLLNPQRSIPPAIRRLTGITPDMVAGAPYFADVADELAAFLDGAIFVAHNVDFDYRFVGQEFRRLGRPFRYPRLCTCASMRRLFPGRPSYSLAALCREFDIPLRNHHRALCDAEAAAELLLLVNERRASASPA